MDEIMRFLNAGVLRTKMTGKSGNNYRLSVLSYAFFRPSNGFFLTRALPCQNRDPMTMHPQAEP
jgi:hypothetical protein